LGPKVTAVLICLAERAGEVVTKDELIACAWDGAPFTSDEALAAVLYELRKALDDDARRPKYVETLRGSGYRLIAPVRPISEHGTETPTATEPKAETPEASHRRRRWMGPPGLALLGVALVVGALLAFLTLRPTAPSPTPAPAEIRSLAVLPLTQLTAGEAVSRETPDPLSTALTDMLTSDLAQLCTQDVAPGIATRGLAAPDADGRWRLDQVIDVLGVDAVVEGTVLRSDDRLWISVLLVETATGRMLWTGSWDRELGDELLVLREVALEAARGIRESLGGR